MKKDLTITQKNNHSINLLKLIYEVSNENEDGTSYIEHDVFDRVKELIEFYEKNKIDDPYLPILKEIYDRADEDDYENIILSVRLMDLIIDSICD